MTGYIKVSSEQLVATSGEFQSAGSTIQNLTSEMMNKVNGLSAYWEGEAAQSYMAKFKSLEGDITKLMSMINEHVTDLQNMAEVYSTAETGNNEEAGSLRTGIIS